MGSRRSGRPRYNAQVHATIVKHLKAGAFLAHAAEAADVSVDAAKEWLAKGLEGDKRYQRFALEVRRLRAEDAIRNQAVVSTAAMRHHEGDWKAAAWNLERKFPKLYGHAAMQAAVTVRPSAADGGTDDGSTTTVQFYLPANGRRPQDGEPGGEGEDEGQG
jgi:hypothetical protein